MADRKGELAEIHRHLRASRSIREFAGLLGCSSSFVHQNEAAKTASWTYTVRVVKKLGITGLGPWTKRLIPVLFSVGMPLEELMGAFKLQSVTVTIEKGKTILVTAR